MTAPSLASRIDAILGQPTPAAPLFSIDATCPSCGGTLDVDHVGQPTSRTTDAEVTCGACRREFVLTVALRPRARASEAVA